MTCYLFKLRFTAAVHFGDSVSAVSLAFSQMTFHADRLFSALCQTAALQDPEGPARLAKQVKSGKLKLSDAFPWRENELYLPRPCLEATTVRDSDASDRKVMKKVAYLPLRQYPAFLRSLDGGEPIDLRTLLDRFGEDSTMTRAAVADGQDTLPYAVGQFAFADGCGLYFLAAMDESEFGLFCTLVRQTGYGGLGGKVSSGCGSFVLEQASPVGELEAPQGNLLTQALEEPDAALWVSLTTSLPREEELESALDGALYQLVRRAGFVQSAALKGPQKKREQFFLAAGSTFRNTYTGDLYEVAPSGCSHTVYRYSVPMFLGVNAAWLKAD